MQDDGDVNDFDHLIPRIDEEANIETLPEIDRKSKSTTPNFHKANPLATVTQASVTIKFKDGKFIKVAKDKFLKKEEILIPFKKKVTFVGCEIQESTSMKFELFYKKE